MKKITLNIDKNGNTTIVDVVGYGASCQSVTAGVEKRLGKVDESSRQETENMYIPEQSLDIKQEG